MAKETIGLICPANIKYAPYVENYISILKEKKADYKIISWNKAGIEEDVDYHFDFVVSDSNRKKMLIGYIRYISYCKKVIAENSINKLLIMTAAPCFFMGINFLSKKRFILDIRDDSPFIRKFPDYFKKICSKADDVVVSSNNFSAWTGRETHLCHNVNMDYVNKYKDIVPNGSNVAPIRIVFAGMMIEKDMNLSMINQLANDSRYAMEFIGKPNANKEEIEAYVRDAKINNVSFSGTYAKDEIVDIYRNKADLVNIFREKTIVNRNALPNKMYDAILAGVPIVVFEHNEAISKYVTEYGLGVSLSESFVSSLADDLYESFKTFDFDEYCKGRIRMINSIIDDMNKYRLCVESFI